MIDDLVYMVTGEDKNGDTTIFVTTDRQRADKRQDHAGDSCGY